MVGIIVRSINELYTVSYQNDKYNCKIKGKLRTEKIIPLVGDKVIFDKDTKIINKILKRKNMLLRPQICNIDYAVLVISVKEPKFSSYLLDKMLIIAEYNNIIPIIYFSKMDLLTFKEKLNIRKYIKYYQSIGYQCFSNKNFKKLKKIFTNNTTVLTGQSGVGKSTLLNKLDKNLSLKTDIVSISLGRGKNTTTHVELFALYNGLVADTPGFSALDFIDIDKDAIRDNIIEFNNYKKECQYKDCFHINEEKCLIKVMVGKNKILKSRYENYMKFIKEYKEGKNG